MKIQGILTKEVIVFSLIYKFKLGLLKLGDLIYLDNAKGSLCALLFI